MEGRPCFIGDLAEVANRMSSIRTIGSQKQHHELNDVSDIRAAKMHNIQGVSTPMELFYYFTEVAKTNVQPLKEMHMPDVGT